MKKIFKYKIDFNPGMTVSLLMPINAKILTTGIQKNELFIWALIDEKEKLEDRYFQVYATGEEINNIEKQKYVTSIIGDYLVWHLFERY
jgi:hypothetical protein